MEVVGDTVLKRTFQTYPTQAAANAVVDELYAYDAALADESLVVASLIGARSVARDGGFYVEHSYPYIAGSRLCDQFPVDDRRQAVGHVLGQVNAMRTFGDDPDSLLVPGDISARNVITAATDTTIATPHGPQTILAGTPVSIDMLPVLARRPDGTVPMERFRSRSGNQHGYAHWLVATKSGAMVRLLSGTIDRGDARVRYALTTRDGWAYDALASAGKVHPTVERRVRQEIRAHFVPYLARTVMYWKLDALNRD